MSKLPRSFYLRDDVIKISKELLGKFLVSSIHGEVTAGMITETEAYAGAIDSASHAYKGRRTRRTEIMFAEGGTAYVYVCYGIHHLFNVVTNKKDAPHAVLIRSVEPVEGMETMLKRRGMSSVSYRMSCGPGALAKAMGISIGHTGVDLLKDDIWIEDRGVKIHPNKIQSTIRVGVEGSGKDARLLYRFIIEGNRWITRTPK